MSPSEPSPAQQEPAATGSPSASNPPLESASKLRLAKIRHDLLTPINHIIGYSEIQIEDAEGQVPEAFLADLRKIRGGGEQLLTLINQHFNEAAFSVALRDPHQLCHELRTPVNHIIGYSELLMEQCDELGRASSKADLAKIHDAAKTWLALMERELIDPTRRDPSLGRTVDHTQTEILARLGQKVSTPLPHDRRVLSAPLGHLLVADDDEPNRELLSRRLEKLGYEVTSSANGRDALKLLQTSPFDLVLLDMLMPGMDGAEVLTRLKADPALRNLPVIMISALDQIEGIVRCIELGAEDYVGKPFNPVFLQARIGAVLEKKRLRDWEQVYLKQIEEERAKSERLLLNVLPRPIADRLKQGETMIVDSFGEVTVLFADLVGFTELSVQLPPALVVRLLNDIFTAFDELAARHGLEKIKTIGDAYMAVAGLPSPRDDHAEIAARMALDMREALRQFNEAHRMALHMRIGINSGPVIAGIIGRHKFAYDLWGDTVNLASRMESHGQPGTIQVTEATAARLRDKFELEKRGVVSVKGKGRLRTFLLVASKSA